MLLHSRIPDHMCVIVNVKVLSLSKAHSLSYSGLIMKSFKIEGSGGTVKNDVMRL